MLEVNWLHLIPLLPLIGAAFCGLAGRFVPKAWVYAVALSSVLLSFLVCLTGFHAIAFGDGGPVQIHELAYHWFSAGTVSIDVGLTFDRLSGSLVVLITFVSFFIHLYSVAYIDEDPGYWRYFAFLNLFVAAMLLLVLGDNLVAMFVGWEGVGFCSYLLIGFWYEDDAKAYAGRKAFIVNRIGDFAFLIGIFVLFEATGSVGFVAISQAAPSLGLATCSIAALLLFIGATGKSAQLPLYIWLPDAMAGPTPVSALIHAATMVTAGVYMIARLSGLYVNAPGVMAVVAVVGCLTALVAALIATTQQDIKKVLAYSTVSQLGYMFIGVGVGAFFAGTEHLITHMFFKACLFLCAGVVIHGLHGEQDMRKMGGLKKYMPHTRLTFLIATIAITGTLPLSGFFSKDEILGQALRTSAFKYLTFTPGGSATLAFVGPLIWLVGTFTAFLTAFYMWRCYYLTFEGEYRGNLTADTQPHEGSWLMTLPLWILAFLSIVGLIICLPSGLATTLHLEVFTWENFTEGIFRPLRSGPSSSNIPELATYAIALAVALVGWWIAVRLYRSGEGRSAVAADGEARAEAFVQRWPRLHSVLEHKFYVDEFYNFAIVRPLWSFAKGLWRIADAWFIDGLVNGAGQLVSAAGRQARKFQNGDVQRYAAVTAVGVAALVYVFLAFGSWGHP